MNAQFLASHVNHCITKPTLQMAPVSSVPPIPLLAVGECKRSGLILCKQHYAEFVGPGAAIRTISDTDFVEVIAIGSPEIIEVTTYEERQKAYSRKIQWVRWLNRIVSEPEPNQRVEKLFLGFEEFFGSEILAKLSDEALALLAGVLPTTIHRSRSQQQYIERSQSPSFPSSDGLEVSVVTLDRQASLEPEGSCSVPLNLTRFITDHLIPRSA